MSARIRTAALVVMAGASAALAQTDLTYQVRRYSPFNNTGWASTMTAQPGDRIEVRSVVSTHGATGAAGLSYMTFQPIVSGWALDDHLLTNSDLGLTGQGYFPQSIGPFGSYSTTPVGYVPDLPGIYGRVTPFASGSPLSTNALRGHIHSFGSALLLRIAQNNVTNWIGVGPTSGTGLVNNWGGGGGVNSGQGRMDDGRPSHYPPPRFGTQNLVTFKFSFILGDETARSLSIDTPPEGIGGAWWDGEFTRYAVWFATTNEIVGSIRESVSVHPASITIGVPTDPNPSPPTVILGGFLLAITHRRRR